jgi:predicted SnoaL-like aldol condensation-catalyzing enzyme
MVDSNKDAAVAFLRLASSGQAREAHERFVAADFRHHNPSFEGSASVLMAAMEEDALQNPGKSIDVKHVIGEGDLVVVHSHVQHHPDQRGFAVVHIFRFADERIVELWDLGQEVPEQSPNQYGMF